jgi:soluble lytic murein transglycosylase-like protein
MADAQPGAAPHEVEGLGIRHGAERRGHRRRRRTRGSSDRRRGERRRRRIRTLLLAAATIAAPGQVRTHAKSRLLTPSVSVSLNDFRAVSPEKAYDAIIEEAATTYGLDPDLIRAVMRTESAFNPLVVSPVGAQGLMQLMPDLADEMGVTDPFDPRQNVMGGAKYLRHLLDTHHGNVPLTLASYNAGPGNVAKYKAIPPFPETRRYVKKVTGLLAVANDD